jgi:hypothetical protein
MQADAHADGLLRILSVVCVELALNGNGALQPAARTVEGQQEAVSLKLDLIAAVCREPLARDAVVATDDFARFQVTESLRPLGEGPPCR